ncbi:hypothetical protein FB45DRAFT_405178 [Roridomyces roridus]|uniref:Uncharacterized protein n=1 Tax=Roridomyces roridus TaxID=1738132 RepID=A0AAD7FUE1_9AGAR|nr:hypothetical protein FB45DRAFT_405178 [Roridomyces roridus]
MSDSPLHQVHFSPSLPTETDAAGNTNNVYTSPPKPEPVNGGPVNGIVIEASAEPTVTAAPLAPDVPIAIVPVNSEETNPSPAAETSAETELPSTHTPVTAPPAETTVPLAETTPVSEPVSAPVPETTTKTEQPTSTSVTPRTETQHTFPSANGADSAASVASSTTSSPSKYGTVGSRKNRKSIFRRITGIFGSDKEGRK